MRVERDREIERKWTNDRNLLDTLGTSVVVVPLSVVPN